MQKSLNVLVLSYFHEKNKVDLKFF